VSIMTNKNNNSKTKLKRELTNRHIKFISLGGTIGTGLFLGANSAIMMAGPSIILAYILVGIIVFFFMRQLGEMSTNEPKSGSSSYFASKYWGNFPGFLAGWNYWLEYILSGMVQLTAVAAYVQYWAPNLESWKIILFFFILINLINIITVKAFGEIEFWLSSIKILTILIVILIGLYIIIFKQNLIAGASIKNLWMPAVGVVNHNLVNCLFPNNILGFIISLPIIIFSFDGIESIGITAAETKQPEKTIPKAVNQTMLWTLVLYIGSFIILLSLCHWSNLNMMKSPFVFIFDRIGIKYAAWILNFVILTAALSVYNSCIYSNSRMLYSLALHNNAPKIFAKINKNGIPILATLTSATLTFLIIPLNYLIPNWQYVLKITIDFSVIGTIINWGIISITHLKFRRNLSNKNILFKSPFYPYSNYITIGFLVLLIVIMLTIKQLNMFRLIIMAPIWIVIVYIWYKIQKK
jgi:L-asparagine transporter-like permease